MNVCGLKSLLKCPEFVEFLNKYDDTGVQESMLDDCDTVIVEGFEFFMNNRQEYSRSGGTRRLVKKILFNIRN